MTSETHSSGETPGPDAAEAARLAAVADSRKDPAAHTLSKVGHHYRMPDFYEVGREKIREYARAVHDDHPAHVDEAAAKSLGYDSLIAPLTFVSVIGIIVQKAIFETVITGYDLSQIMQADQRLEFHRTVRSGDRLTADVVIESFRQMGGSDIIVTKNVLSDEGGEAVVTSWTTLVARSGAAADVSFMETVKGVMRHDA